MNTTVRGLGAALLMAGLAACTTSEAAEENGHALQTADVTAGDLTLKAEATGTVEPIRSVEVKSKASGEILKLHADVGDEVEPASLLAEVDPRDVRNRFDQAEADLEVAKARVEITKAQLDRSAELLEAGVITQQENETTRLDYANAQANLVKAQTNYELAQLQLGDVTIRAPMAGTILAKNVEEGQVIQSASQNVSGGTTLFIMANLDQMQVRTLVDETDMGEIRAGLSASVKVEAYPDRTFHGVVEKIEPQAVVQQNVTMFPVIVSLDNRSGLLKPGMNAEVEVLIDRATDVLLVPNNAIVQVSDVGPAALALGLDPDELDLRSLLGGMRGGVAGGFGGRVEAGDGAGSRGGESRPREAGAPDPAGSQRAATGGANPPAGQAGPSGGVRARMDSLRAKVQRGEIDQDSLRAAFRSLRGSGDAGGPGGLDRGAAGGATADGAAPPRETRPAVVFVLGPDSVPRPRAIRVGLNDWDNTQVVSGLEEGETLVVVGAAQLLAQQQEWLNRIRNRMGGSPFGGGGRPPGGGRGR